MAGHSLPKDGVALLRLCPGCRGRHPMVRGREQCDRPLGFGLFRRAVVVPRHLVAEIDEGTDHEREGRQTDGDREVADDDVGRGEVDHRGDGPEGDGLGQCPADREPAPVTQPRRCTRGQTHGHREAGRAEIIPRRLVPQVEQGASDQGEGGQTRRRRELADHHVVGREVERRDDNAKRDGLGHRPLDAERGSGGRRRMAVPLVSRSHHGPVLPTGGRVEQRPQSPT